MKRIWSLSLLVLIISCAKTEKAVEVISEPSPSTVYGKWKLIETYSDPGDGSGTFEAANSNKTFEFLNDGTLLSNGEICSLSTDVGTATNSTFSIITKMISCPNNYTMSYELLKGQLLVYFPCIEGCTFKFERI